MSRPDAILIAGPTATGKSALAVALAQRHGGLVVNADSMQVYRDLRIITARPSPDEEVAAAHALFGTIDGAEPYSVSRWLADAAGIIAMAREAGLLPIVVGGTGLYFKALTEGLSDIPPVPAALRARIRAEAEGRPAAALHADLAARDPLTAARLRPSDPQRILRALEVQAATGRSLASFQDSRLPPLLDPTRCLGLVLTLDRAALRDRIDRRFDAMIQAGAVDEVERLSRRELDPVLPVMRAHGVPPLLRHIREGLDLDVAIETGKADSRRYIKRQETFARHQLPSFAWVETTQAEAFVRKALC